MGTRGPIGKRDEERVRRNTPDNPTETISVIGTVDIPELGDIAFDGETHPIVEEMYQSIKDSAAVKFYEPTDWQFARLTLLTLNEELIFSKRLSKPIGAMKLTAINQMMSALLLTEGDRRRARVEIERAPNSGADATVVQMSDLYAQRLGLG
ncbi:terminase small subunit [Gordonia phage Strosahl]|uniref:Terminase small subunit n=2 Tax=Soupsvirus strosahl TaxID=2560510 RepID=A0A1B3B187_9CAUD|nr:minor tail protein [Gordonia phage Rosalind]YP_009281619.1 minor tail protein [Gordonia phage Remus]YP_009285949.1 minor tail protein [Gordonia phage JSwag]YP_009596209.1 minor tail protein [Gordonia phage Strosahl]ASZ73885.1 terminase small subunit [Gordonia phage ShayRa]AXH47806.1 terminase small subunit [Gordonia phage LastResort]QDM56184.1 terminase small subunit [Gordonia phage ReMo]QFP95073.1 terminase small subunit [Gordonia phage MinecraftSteve]QLF84881.1 terminase small subunit 